MDLAPRREVLIAARHRAGLSIPELSKLCGVSVKTIDNIECGYVSRPSPKSVKPIAEALGVPLDEVYDFKAVAS